MFAIIAAAFLLAVSAISATMESAAPVVQWMKVYLVQDLGTFGQAVDFFRDLRIPVPPNLAVIETLDYWLTGDVSFATGFLYHAYIVISYGCVVAIVYPSRIRLLIASLLGVLFVLATKYIHPGNPELYDVAAPCFFLAFVALLRWKSSVIALVLAGFALGMFEMSRPYVIYLVPFMLVTSWVRIANRRRFLVHILPLVVLNGGWHAHLLLAHGQVTMTNHAGFNMWRAWEPQIPNQHFHLVHEDDEPRGPAHYFNLNNPQHLQNSRIYQDRIVHYVLHHRSAAIGYIARRIFTITEGRSDLYWHFPPKRIATIYSLAVRITSILMWIGFVLLLGRFGWLLARDRGRLRELVADLDNLVILVGALSMAVLAIGELGEEARFMISVLPMLATVPPIYRLVGVVGLRSQARTLE